MRSVCSYFIGKDSQGIMKFSLEIDFDDVDYAQAIRALLPYIKKEDIPLPSAVLDAAEAPGVLENFLRFVPKSEQDRIFLGLIEKNETRMIERIEKLADKNGVDLNITKIKLSEQ